MKKMTAEQLKEYFTNYHLYLQAIEEFHEDTKNLLPAAATAQYGIEATMPKGSGGNSDPTFNQVANGVVSDSFIKTRMFVVQAIGRMTKHVKGQRQTDVLACWLEGKTIVETSATLNIAKSTVGDIRLQIIQAIMKGEGFDG